MYFKEQAKLKTIHLQYYCRCIFYYEIKDHFLSGKTTGEIAKLLDVNQGSIIYHLKQAGVYKNAKEKITPEIGEKIAELYKSGIGCEGISKQFDLVPTTIKAYLKRNQIRIREKSEYGHRILTTEEKSDIISKYNTGSSVEELGVELQTDPGRVSGYLKSMGITIKKKSGFSCQTFRRANTNKKIMKNGYSLVWVENTNPYFDMVQGSKTTKAGGYIFEHRYVMAESLGRCLTSKETVHHIDGDRSNNDISNLQLMTGIHTKGVALKCACCKSNNIIPDTI